MEDIFLKLTDVPGESKDDKHKDEIQLMTCNFGVQQTGVGGYGGGSGAGKASFTDIACAANVSKASPTLWQDCASGKHHDEAVIVFRKAGEKPLEYLKVTLKEVLVSSYNAGSSGDTAIDSFGLNYSTMNIEYFEQTETGAGKGATTAGWDVKGNVKK